MNNLEEDKEDKIVDIINAFQTYYKILFNKKENVNMFEELDTNNPLSTNRSMEFLFEHIYKYNENEKNKNGNNKLYNETDDINLDDYDEFYTLIINGEIQKLSNSLFSIIEYLVTTNKNWYEIKWKIINLKNN